MVPADSRNHAIAQAHQCAVVQPLVDIFPLVVGGFRVYVRPLNAGRDKLLLYVPGMALVHPERQGLPPFPVLQPVLDDVTDELHLVTDLSEFLLVEVAAFLFDAADIRRIERADRNGRGQIAHVDQILFRWPGHHGFEDSAGLDTQPPPID